ncbi:MAG: SpoIIE family protein phosphatase [Planctomycetota bacterium]|jgi:serine phosphatase RsbU (regulator of sigma subunit)
MRLNPRHWPIAARITGALIVLTVSAVFTVTAFGLRRGREALQGVTHESIEQIAAMTAQRIDKLIRKTKSDCEALSRNEAVIDACGLKDDSAREAARRQLQVTADIDNDLSWALLAAPDGTILAAHPPVDPPADKPFDIKEREYFRVASAGKPYISGMLAGRITGNPGVYFSYPVYSRPRVPRDNEPRPVLGIVMIKLDGEMLHKLIAGVKIETEGFAVLLEQVLRDEAAPRVIIAHPDPKRQYSTFRALSPEQVQEIDPWRRWGLRTIPTESARLLSGGEGKKRFEAELGGDFFLGAVAELRTRPWTIVAVQPESEFLGPFRRVREEQAITVLAVLLFACLLAYLQSRSILRPVRVLTTVAERIAAGDLDARADIGTSDELGRLAGVFDRMVPQLRDNLKLQQSLALASEVQARLLPHDPPQFPGLEVAGTSLSYEQIGGDYFDYIDLRPWDDERLGIAVGDISGHGIAAAMLMATARAHVRSGAQPLADLGQLFCDVNRRLEDDLGEEKFMTLAFYVFDPAAGRVDWVSAGQDPAFHYRKESGEIEEVPAKGVPLGVLEGWEYAAKSRSDLAPGDVLIIGTDGIWETRNAAKEEFGKTRLRALLSDHHAKSAQEIVEIVLDRVEGFRGDLPRQDDITIVVVRIG